MILKLSPQPRSFMAAVSQIGGILQAPGLLEVKLRQTYRMLQESLNCDLIWFGLAQDKGRAIVNKGGSFPKSNPSVLINQRLVQPGDLEDVVLGYKKLIQVPDIQEDLRCRAWWKAAQDWDIHGIVAFPITHQGEVLGIGILGQHRWGLMLGAEEEEGLSLLGGLLGAAVASDEGQVRRQEELTTPLLTMADRLRQAYDTETVLQAVVDELYDRLTPTRVVIYWLADPREFEVRAFAQHSSIHYVLPLGMRIAVKDISGLYQQLCQDRTTSIADVPRDIRGYISKTLIQKLQIQAVLAHPIILQKELLGYLSLEQCGESRIWTDQEQRLVQGMANLVGVTTTQAKLYEIERRRFLEQMLINRIIKDIRNSLDPSQVMASAVDRLGQGLNVDRCILLSYEPNNASGLRILHQFCKPGIPRVGPTLPWPEAEADRETLTSATPVTIEDISADFRFLDWREALGQGSTRSMMLCGLAHQGQPNGILCLHRCFIPQPWTQEEREIFQAVADQVGIALGQAMVFQQTQQQVEVETKLNQSARRISQSTSGDQVLRLLLRELAQTIKVPQVILVGRKGKDWELLAQHIHSAPILRSELNLWPHYPIWEHVLQTEEVLPLSGPLEGLGNGIYSGLTGRVTLQQELQAVVLLLDQEDRIWQPTEKQLVQRLIQETLVIYTQTTAFIKLQNLSAQLKSLNEYRNTMVSIASHEMRTPLASISLYVETLLMDRELITDDELGQMQIECNRMTDLLNNLSTLVDLESNTTQFTFQNVVLSDIILHLRRRITSLAERYQAQVKLEDHIQGIQFITDEKKLETILYNLLENACKHTQPGVVIKLKIHTSSEFITFTVSDTGQGISEDKLKTLFQPFMRVEDVMNHSKGGAGLGLAITRELVEKLGGEVTVTSTIGKGSSFVVRLPLTPPT